MNPPGGIRRRRFIASVAAALLLAGLAEQKSRAATIDSGPADGPEALARIAEVVEREIAAAKFPGAVVLVGRHDRILYRRAFGSRALVPNREAMTVDTIFDLASLTKVVVTTTASMQLIESRRLALDDRVARHWPAFASNGKQDITIEDLLTHMSGLRPDLDLRDAWKGRKAALMRIENERPATAPGSRFVYSDINFEALGAIVERIAGQSLADYAKRRIFAPLGMSDTSFKVPPAKRARTAPTDSQDGVLRRAVVQDPTAFRMGGVAGDAGVFGTADDLAKFATAILERGSVHAARVLDAASIARMTAARDLPGGVLRGLGWDIASPYSGGFDKAFGPGSFGHTGYTGTALWIDPASDLYLIILTSRLHPDDRGDVRALRTEIADIVATALKPPKVMTGLDVLEARGFAALAGKRVGLVTNDSARDGQGRRAIDVLAAAPDLRLAALFTPEHGLQAKEEGKVEDTTDPTTGVPIYSLYGATRRPDPSLLKGLDALVVDLPDVGVRFFTYATTMAYAMEAAAPLGLPVYVLDRPNPLDAEIVEGPVPDPGRNSFTGYFALPLRHGMTLGELARLFNQENRIDAKLTVIALENYRRANWYDETGLAWNSPSPNLPSLDSATLYPGVGLVEGANVSVGRGTPRPFGLLGAPWIDGTRLAVALRRRGIDGVAFEPASFTPTKDRYAGQLCRGVSVLVTDRRVLDAGRLGLELIAALHRLYPKEFEIARTRDLIGSAAVFDAIVAGKDARKVAESYGPAVAKFRALRAQYLLYP